MGIVIIIFIIILVVIITTAYTSNKEKAMLEQITTIPDFVITRKIIGNDVKSGIAYDDTQKKVCLIKRTGNGYKKRLFSYNEILSVEILEDGKSITKTDRGSQIGRALIGGLVLGPIGLLIGGLTGKKKSISSVRRIDLQIIVNDISDPRYIVNFLNVESKRDSFLYKSSIECVRQWYSIIEVLIEKADIEDSPKDINKYRKSSDVYLLSDELKKLSELKDAGILTDSEFQQQKRKLLRENI